MHKDGVQGYFGKRKRAKKRNDDVGEDDMRGNDPAWIIAGSADLGGKNRGGIE